jgi:phage gp46-like protein
MSDLRTAWRDLAGDLALKTRKVGNADVTVIDGLDEDEGIETAVVLSLFTDRRAQPGDPLPVNAQLAGTPDRRGWWGDTFPNVPGDRIGSRLWLLNREKEMPAVLARAREYAMEALQWLIEDGIARSVNVTAEVVRRGVLGLAIEIVRSDKPVAQYRFEHFWNDV